VVESIVGRGRDLKEAEVIVLCVGVVFGGCEIGEDEEIERLLFWVERA
jgi:hypothetical protein